MKLRKLGAFGNPFRKLEKCFGSENDFDLPTPQIKHVFATQTVSLRSRVNATPSAQTNSLRSDKDATEGSTLLFNFPAACNKVKPNLIHNAKVTYENVTHGRFDGSD